MSQLLVMFNLTKYPKRKSIQFPQSILFSKSNVKSKEQRWRAYDIIIYVKTSYISYIFFATAEITFTSVRKNKFIQSIAE